MVSNGKTVPIQLNQCRRYFAGRN